MEFILQALTYPEIGQIGYTDANLDTQKAISDVRSFAAQDYDVILSYPDAGEALVPAYRAATEQGAQVVTWSSGKVGEPGTDYLTYSGSDICAVANAWGDAVRQGAARRRPDRPHRSALRATRPIRSKRSASRRRCPDNIEHRRQARARRGAVRRTSRRPRRSSPSHPDIDGIVGSYGDAFVGAMRAFDAAGISMDGLVTMHQSDDNPFLCAWKDAGGVMDSYTYVALLVEGRTGMTAAMMKIAGYDVPAVDHLRRLAEAGDDGLVPHRHPARRLAVEPGAGRAAEPDVPRMTDAAPARPGLIGWPCVAAGLCDAGPFQPS